MLEDNEAAEMPDDVESTCIVSVDTSIFCIAVNMGLLSLADNIPAARALPPRQLL